MRGALEPVFVSITCANVTFFPIQPSDSDAISEDISDAETESDIECEKVGESGFVQLKEKTVSCTKPRVRYLYVVPYAVRKEQG